MWIAFLPPEHIVTLSSTDFLKIKCVVHEPFTPRRQSVKVQVSITLGSKNYLSPFMATRQGEKRQGKKKKKTYLRCKVEPQPARALYSVLDQQRNLVGQANLDLWWQCGSLAEVDQVLEGEGQGHGLAELDLNVQLGLLDVLVAAEGNSAVTNIACACKLDTVLACINGN